ncbi:hypothetical protein NV379_24035 [Paenibacillus sp. N1-5-1-14]|uniref:hypothetical protein n=1 Tax=Paenibacillus radicibacter TaxID=2972488 RepID=UPI0021598479|nr:hypothetical protein [Paenibacillus radicibacter]MCR8645714.1 hypothetical protein [Paenibacillus radicibacter]
MKRWLSVFLLFLLIGCNQIPKDRLTAKLFLEQKGYKMVSYEGHPENYELTSEKLIAMPYMMVWGLQQLNPKSYIGKMIHVEKFIVSNHPLSRGNVVVNVFEVEGKPVGGTSIPYSDSNFVMAGGCWSLEGKSLEEIQGETFQSKTFQEWRADWISIYGK